MKMGMNAFNPKEMSSYVKKVVSALRSFDGFEKKFPANIIEIVGPPGVGKTTLYNSLRKQWHSGSNWTCVEMLLKEKPASGQLFTWLTYWMRTFLKKTKIKEIAPNLGVRFIETHKEFAESCWDLLSLNNTYGDEESSQRFRSAYLLFTDFCRYQAVIEANPNNPCVINEGLLQKSFLLRNNSELIESNIKSYVSLVPLPKAVLHISTSNKDVIIDRLKKRKKVIAMHLGKNENALIYDIEQWQYSLSILLKNLDSKNVPIFNIDSEKSISENARLMDSVLNEIASISPKGV